MLKQTLEAIGPLNHEIMKQAQYRVDHLIKPVGSLGKLESYYVQLAGIAGSLKPTLGKKEIIVMAADHGIYEEGIAATDRAVTLAQAENMTIGLTGVCALAKASGAQVTVVDIGIDADQVKPEVWPRKIRRGTANMAREHAMTRPEAIQAIEVGIEMANRAIDQGARVLGIGEMGVGNTTPSAAIVSVFSGRPAIEVTGPGANLPQDRMGRKVQVIEEAIAQWQPDPSDPIDVLAKVGGLEIGGMAGVILGAAAKGVPVIVDGFIASASALLAKGLSEASVAYMIPSHQSMEPGATVAADLLGFDPPLALDMRLGEGTGAAMMFGVLEAALAMNNHMITFDEAGFVAP